jgi:NAT, N-acetyltransferase, of N-acetylglutamate synthase
MLIDDAIRLFLDSIGRSEEYEFYLNKFRTDRSSCFAILCPDEESCRSGSDALGLAIGFLLRLDLLPALLLSGPRAGVMLTTLEEQEPDIVVWRPTFRAAQATDADRAELARFIESARRRRSAPTLVWEGETLLPALEFLASAVAARVHLIRMRGALKSEDGQNLLYVHESDQNGVEREDRALASAALDLARRSDAIHISVTSPFNIMKEIFTVKGAGTIVRRGSRILELTPPYNLDRERLKGLLTASFQKRLLDESCIDRASAIYLEENYTGAILIEETPQGAYLSKFAVDTQARGVGVAQELWERAVRRHPALYWRSRVSNSINRWYARLADGLQRVAPWMIFWRGVRPEQIPDIIAACRSRSEDFAPRDAPPGS